MNDVVFNALIELGLTSGEARVYIAAVRVGVGTAREISVLAVKERAYTHHILRRLQQLGIVEATMDTPTRFRPMDIKKTVDHLYSLQATKLRRLDKVRSDADSLLSDHLDASPGAETYSIVKGRANTYLKMIETIQACDREISLILSGQGLTRLGRYEDFLDVMKKKFRKGVAFRMISEITSDNVRDAKIFARVSELRHVKNQFVNASIYDKKIGSVALSINENLDIDAHDHVALWTNAKSFVGTLESFFNSIWFVAAPIEPTMRVIHSEQAAYAANMSMNE